MHAFQSIALSKNTSLAVVAPSIAEALFATAIGLIAAIPAYIAYNKFSTDAGKFADRLEQLRRRPVDGHPAPPEPSGSEPDGHVRQRRLRNRRPSRPSPSAVAGARAPCPRSTSRRWST
jgi:hypothetical protein